MEFTGITGLYGRFWVLMHTNPTVTYGSGSSLETNKSGVDKIEPPSVQPVLIFYQLSHGQDPVRILGDRVGPWSLPLILWFGVVAVRSDRCHFVGKL